jgi:archaellum component FlaG (FlaF/FlaG flagellin family)
VQWRSSALARIMRFSCLVAFALASPALAEEVSKQQLQGLDEQVQEIKSDVLDIASELAKLEEQLLYPSGTQLAVFVALAEEESFRLDSIEVSIDGEPIAHHLYSFKELEALQKGGVQRIYTGNVASGSHRLTVSMQGMRPNGQELAATEGFSFDKGIEPKRVAITLADGDAGEAPIQLGGW